MGELVSELKLGPVTLAVADLDEMARFYRDGVGLDVLSESPTAVVLGQAAEGALESASGTNAPASPIEILKLVLQPELAPDNRAAAGLYHLAILFPTKATLASSVNSVAQKYPANFSGSADHLVSEAFYFNDPEGNGVELYWDRDKSKWPRVGEYIRMDTLPLDPNTFLRENLAESGAVAPATPPSDLPAGKPITLGHVHLRVGNLAEAEDFYVNKVGFDKTFQFGSQALFVSAGGYHHHLGMNTWQSAGAGPRNPSRGLAQFEILLPSASDVTNLRDRLEGFGVPTEPAEPVKPAEPGFTFFDPWLNRIRVAAA